MSTLGVNGLTAPRRMGMDAPQAVERAVPATQPEPLPPFTVGPGRTDPSRALLAPPTGRDNGTLAALLHRPTAIRKMFGSLSGRDSDVDMSEASAALAAHVEQGGTLEGFAAASQFDAAQVYLLGLFARSSTQRRNDPRLARVLQDFADAHGTELNAAINSASALGAFGKTQIDLAWMRALYQSAVMESATLQDIFESLLARFGVNRFEEGARAMLRAFSDDLASPHASMGLDRLQLVITHGMIAVRNILGIIHSGDAFLLKHGGGGDGGGSSDGRQGEGGEGGARDNSPTAHLVKLLLQLCVSSAAVKLVPPFLGTHVGTPEDDAMHLRRLHSAFIGLVDSLPSSLWKQRGHKDQLIRALRQQSASDVSDV